MGEPDAHGGVVATEIWRYEGGLTAAAGVWVEGVHVPWEGYTTRAGDGTAYVDKHASDKPGSAYFVRLV
jgi:hypothetical protein